MGLHLDLGLAASRTVGNTFLLFSPLVCGAVLRPPELTETQVFYTFHLPTCFYIEYTLHLVTIFFICFYVLRMRNEVSCTCEIKHCRVLGWPGLEEEGSVLGWDV